MSGFIRFTEPEPEVVPTTLQKIALLSAGKKTDLLNYFIMGRGAHDASRSLGISDVLAEHIFNTIDSIQQTAKLYMRGEVIITAAVLDVDGNVITPAVMNIAPTTQTALGTILQPMFLDTFTSGQVTAIVSAMMKWCKYDGTGTFAFYSTNIKL